jgi:cytoskeleton protein RodZ
MDLKEIGTALREGRERKALSVEAVEEKIKIAPSVITALEEGNRERFPHPVYAKGFVRSYALLLGLDAVELCAHFSREYPVPADTEHPEAHAPQIRVKMHDSGHVITAVRIVAIFGILALGALGWYAFDVYRSRQPQVSAPAEEVNQTAPAAPAQSLPSEPLPAPMTQMQEVAAQSEENMANASLAADQNSTSGAASNASVVTPPAPATEKAQVAPAPANATKLDDAAKPLITGKERMLRITAHSASWLQARPDDKVVDYFLRKGESASIGFSKSLSIKFGNAGGVKLELDGKPYPFEAALGEVKTLVVE